MKNIKMFSILTCAAAVIALTFSSLIPTAAIANDKVKAKSTSSAKSDKTSKPLKVKAKKPKRFTNKEKFDLCAKIKKSVVLVTFEVSHDKKGEAPDVLGNCPENVGTLLEEERPLEIPAYVLSNNQVFIDDPNIPARYIKSIFVKHGGKKIKAKYEKYFIFGDYAILKLEKPLKNVTPLKFDAKAKGANYAFNSFRWDTRWCYNLENFKKNPLYFSSGERIISKESGYFILNRKGVSAGFSIRSLIPENYNWKGSPLKSKDAITVDNWKKIVAQTKKTVKKNIYFATLYFRSPKKQQEHSDYSDDSTEVETLAIKSPIENMVVILSEFKAKRTARLEKIILKVHQPDGSIKKVNAKFRGSLKDYGCFVATTEETLPGGKLNWAKPDTSFKALRHLQPGVQIRMQGNSLEYFYHRLRITGVNIGWKNHIYPRLSEQLSTYTLLFSKDGKSLDTLPVSRRIPDTDTSAWGSSGSSPKQTFASDLAAVFKDLDKNVDKSNIPLSEEKEKRLAWMGLILQPMDYELARMMKITDETNDGSSGAMVSYVYPGSPADKAGIKAGDFILRLNVEGKKEPVDISVSDPVRFSTYFWDRFDDIPESYYDRFPSPWIPIENDFTSMLTNLGIGKKFTAEFIINGKKVKKDFVVTECPKHYGIAKSYKSKPLGVTVKNITPELRRYFQMKKDSNGIIISNIKPGTIASVAGLKPFEIITEINNKPIKSVEDFEKIISKGGNFNFAVKRWIKGRMVKVEIPETK